MMAELLSMLAVPPYSFERSHAEQIAHRIGTAFPEASVKTFAGINNAMPVRPDRQHVFGSAVVCKADAIVTFDADSYPSETLKGFEILLHTPDDFLVHQYHLEADLVMHKIKKQAEATGWSATALIAHLEKIAPQFGGLARGHQWYESIAFRLD
jgi:hypothetical protein